MKVLAKYSHLVLFSFLWGAWIVSDAKPSEVASGEFANLKLLTNLNGNIGFIWEKKFTGVSYVWSNGRTIAQVDLVGIWNRPDWSFLVNEDLVEPNSSLQKAHYLITLTGQSTPVYITAIGPKGQVEEQKWSIVWDYDSNSLRSIFKPSELHFLDATPKNPKSDPKPK